MPVNYMFHRVEKGTEKQNIFGGWSAPVLKNIKPPIFTFATYWNSHYPSLSLNSEDDYFALETVGYPDISIPDASNAPVSRYPPHPPAQGPDRDCVICRANEVMMAVLRPPPQCLPNMSSQQKKILQTFTAFARTRARSRLRDDSGHCSTLKRTHRRLQVSLKLRTLVTLGNGELCRSPVSKRSKIRADCRALTGQA